MEGKRVISSSRACVVLTTFLVGVVMMWNAASVGALTAAQCQEEMKIVVNACKPVLITRKPASPFCCERMRVTHVECVCPVITPQVAPLVDVNYAIKLIQGCGRQVPRHFKCGSITTP